MRKMREKMAKIQKMEIIFPVCIAGIRCYIYDYIDFY